jgi:hypothetical protein
MKIWIWSEDDPESLRNDTSLHANIFVIDNPAAKPSLVWLFLWKFTMSIDPGFYFPHAAFNVGTGKTYLLCPRLGGTLTFLMKQRKQIQSRRDTWVNDHGVGVKEAKAVWEEAKIARIRRIKANDAMLVKFWKI